MSRCTAEDLLQTFLVSISDLDQSKILQVASDSPSVNFLFLKKIWLSHERKKLLPLLDIGRCGLHVIHNRFKTGTKKGSDWEPQKLLKAMLKFLQEAPICRSLYENVSESLDYPLQFSGHCWCENEKSAEKAEMMLEGYQKFITLTCNLKKSQQPDGKNKLSVFKSMIHEPLLPAKLKLFEMVSSKLNVFLRGFQTNKPMVSFIADTLGDLVCDFFGRIILKDVLKKKSDLYNLIQINPLVKNIRKNPESVAIGFAVKHKLEQIKSSLNSLKILEFRKQAGDFLAQLLHHLLEKPPLKYVVLCSAVCFNPMYMRNPAKKSSCESQMDILLQKFVTLGKISA